MPTATFPRKCGEVRLLGDAVDDAAAAATSEDQGVRPLQDLEALDIVEVAVVLGVVADAVDEEVGRGVLAADDTVSRLPSPWPARRRVRTARPR